MARKRRSYEVRSKSNTPAAKKLAEAFCRKIEFATNADGNQVRVWRKDELQTYSNADIARAFSWKRAFEEHELLAEIPPTAIKYAVTKGWAIRLNGLYMATEKGAAELKLPKRASDGMAIKFAKAA